MICRGQDWRRNEITKRPAAWAAIFAVPTAITGWFGQNIPYTAYEHTTGLWGSAVPIARISGCCSAFQRRD